MFIPGLLQTEDYARAVIRAGQSKPDPETMNRRLSARMARQEILERADPPEIWAVLRRISRQPPRRRRRGDACSVAAPDRPGRPVQQHAHAPDPAVQRRCTRGMNGPFVIVTFNSPTDPPMVYLETATDGLYLDEPVDVDRYTLMFNHLVARALGPDESRAKISALAERMA